MSDQEQKLEEVFFQKEGLTEKQQNILAAATEAFAEKGFAATSTSDIAKRAGVAEGTIFRHYKTKKDLLFSIVSPMMVKLMAPIIISDLNKVLNHPYGNFEDFVRAMVKNRAEFLEKNLPTIRILIQEIPFHPELKDEFIKHIGQKVIKRFIKIIEHYQNEGQIIELPPMTVIRLVASTLIGYFAVKYVIAPTFWDDDEELERTIQFLMRGLARK